MTGVIILSSTVHDADVLPYGEFLTEEHHAIREMVRDFATREIAPKAAEVDRNARFPEGQEGFGRSHRDDYRQYH